MTNNLTEAVRRIRQLQQDVERLQSGGGDGEIRELRDIDEVVDSIDSVVLGPDTLSDETTRSSDSAVRQIRQATAVKYDKVTYESGGYS
jgi:hypothetical protein